jgi:G:T-mismatch repair DNA endonuclease (very short patch repair protein)
MQDRWVRRELRQSGWQVITIWECQIKKPSLLLRRLMKMLLTKNYGSFCEVDPIPMAAESQDKYQLNDRSFR